MISGSQNICYICGAYLDPYLPHHMHYFHDKTLAIPKFVCDDCFEKFEENKDGSNKKTE